MNVPLDIHLYIFFYIQYLILVQVSTIFPAASWSLNSFLLSIWWLFFTTEYEIPGTVTGIGLNVSGINPQAGSLVPLKSTLMSLFKMKWINELTFCPVLLVH